MDKKSNLFLKYFLYVKNILISCNTKALIFYKLLCIFLSFIMVLSASLVLRDSVLNNRLYEVQSGFIGISHHFNTGVGFSLFSSRSAFSVYLVQIIPCIIFLFVIVFSKNKLSILTSSLVFAGGMSNVIDRAMPDQLVYSQNIYYHAVVDYWELGFMRFAVFNLPDVIITTSVALFFINILVIVYKEETGPNKRIKVETAFEKV